MLVTVSVPVLAVCFVAGGAGLGVIINHLLVSRTLMKRIYFMRYAGFMGDPPPTPPENREPTIRED